MMNEILNCIIWLTPFLYFFLFTKTPHDFIFTKWKYVLDQNVP